MPQIPIMTLEVRIIEDSINESGNRLTTFQLRYQRFFHAELMTHRVFSRNASSSRAIPVKKVLDQVWNDPAMPDEWRSNIAGMQAGSPLPTWKASLCHGVWKGLGKVACIAAWSMMKIGLHKQWANRVLEPWQYISVIVSSTEWDNFYALRAHKDAQPEFKNLATAMFDMQVTHQPRLLRKGEWHLPYISTKERRIGLSQLKMSSAARCCRVSYLLHDGNKPSMENDVDLCLKLIKNVPIHASPFEHVARPFDPETDKVEDQRNYHGWVQYRTELEKLMTNG